MVNLEKTRTVLANFLDSSVICGFGARLKSKKMKV